VFYDQAACAVRFEWGAAAIRYLAPQVNAVVIVDVLSFSTAVDVALGRGATVLPYRWKDDSATRFAEQHGATLASYERRFTGGYSLSPQSLSTLPDGARLVLPSPNGATLSALAAEHDATVFTACLRNAPAVAEYIQRRFERVLVVAAGERWPDGTLRPAAEDLWGAGAVIAALNMPASPEAQAAIQAFEAVRHDLAAQLRACSSGRELALRGFADDLDWASAYGVSGMVPRLELGAYLNAGDCLS
jgi:2-phosphosulfolactate phosphatase